MGRLEVGLDPGAGVSAVGLAAAWDSDDVAPEAGLAAAGAVAARPGDFFGVVELVVVPLAVNLATNAITALARRLVAGLRAGSRSIPGRSSLR